MIWQRRPRLAKLELEGFQRIVAIPGYLAAGVSPSVAPQD